MRNAWVLYLVYAFVAVMLVLTIIALIEPSMPNGKC